MLLDLLQVLLGLALLLGGGESLVRGASVLARSLGVSSLAVGLTVVAVGTSAPELAVNVAAALDHSTALSFGNVFGSNMANVGLVLAAAALVRPLTIRSGVARRTLPVMILATAAATAMAFDTRLGAAGDEIDRRDGILLLVFLGLFLFFVVGDARRRRNHYAPADPAAPAAASGAPSVPLPSLLLTGVGLAVLAAGARVTVNGSIRLAADVGVSQELIGLTIVAVGTSLPELATSLVAARRGQVDLAVGNVVGSNIFNILLVAGATASLYPIPVPARGHTDLLVNAVLSLALFAAVTRGKRRVTRSEGGVLLAVYAGYMGWRAFGA